jgi:hypothetical protein
LWFSREFLKFLGWKERNGSGGLWVERKEWVRGFIFLLGLGEERASAGRWSEKVSSPQTMGSSSSLLLQPSPSQATFSCLKGICDPFFFILAKHLLLNFIYNAIVGF